MSTMWNVTVSGRGENWVDLDVGLDHPDAGRVSTARGFALQLLLQIAYDFDASWSRVPNGPLGRAVPFDQSYDAEYVETIARRFVKKVVALRASGLPWNEQAAHARMDRTVLDSGIERGSEEWEGAWDDAWRDFWADGDNLPAVTLRVEVTDPEWLAHVKTGKSFDTAAWSPVGPWVSKNFDKSLPTPPDAHGPDPLRAFALADRPRGASIMDAEMIRTMASGHAPVTAEALAGRIAAHGQFLASGGAGGTFQSLEVAGMPLCVYTGAEATDGAQLVLRMEHVSPETPLEGADLRWADLSGLLCEGVSLVGATLDHAVAIDGFFDGARFDGASLRGIDLSRSSAKGASFRDADLREADFENTDCTGADFTGANLEGSRFPGAILEGIRR